MQANFSLERVTSSPANFDSKKLYWLQGEYMKLVPTAEKLERCVPYLRRAGLVGESIDAATNARLTAIIEAAGDRIKLFSDLVQFAGPLLKASPEYDAAAVDKTVKPAAALLRGFRGKLAAAEPFDAPTLEALLKAHAAESGQKPNALVGAIRVAVTGVPVGFGLYETMVILGRDATLRRIDHALTTYCR
jgi:nondiscriminating glutamyl-tRNA synthetase